jgi:hypothetical protein
MASATAPRESELIACEIRYSAVSITCNGHEIELSVVVINVFNGLRGWPVIIYPALRQPNSHRYATAGIFESLLLDFSHSAHKRVKKRSAGC